MKRRCGAWKVPLTCATDDTVKILCRGDALVRLDRAEEALHHFETAVELIPNDASAWDSLGTCLFSLNKFEEARIAIERARALKPNDPLANDSRDIAFLGNEGLQLCFILLNESLRRFKLTCSDADLPQIELIIQIVLLYTIDRALEGATRSAGTYGCGSRSPELSGA